MKNAGPELLQRFSETFKILKVSQHQLNEILFLSPDNVLLEILLMSTVYLPKYCRVSLIVNSPYNASSWNNLHDQEKIPFSRTTVIDFDIKISSHLCDISCVSPYCHLRHVAHPGPGYSALPGARHAPEHQDGARVYQPLAHDALEQGGLPAPTRAW